MTSDSPHDSTLHPHQGGVTKEPAKQPAVSAVISPGWSPATPAAKQSAQCRNFHLVGGNKQEQEQEQELGRSSRRDEEARGQSSRGPGTMVGLLASTRTTSAPEDDTEWPKVGAYNVQCISPGLL